MQINTITANNVSARNCVTGTKAKPAFTGKTMNMAGKVVKETAQKAEKSGIIKKVFTAVKNAVKTFFKWIGNLFKSKKPKSFKKAGQATADKMNNAFKVKVTPKDEAIRAFYDRPKVKTPKFKSYNG